MSCEHPLLAVDYGIDESTGKHNLRILPRRVDYSFADLESKYGIGSLLALPCGHCSQCKSAYMRNWSIRCSLEAKLHEENCFVTLTYDEEHCPKKLVKEHIQKFIKNLRNEGIKFRYFLSGEYGSLSFRPHFHMIMFGYKPKDLQLYSKGDSVGYYFTSKMLTNIWKQGMVIVSDFTDNTAFYTAGYTAKKLDQKLPFEVGRKTRPFCLMSLKPGIGHDYVVKHADSIRKYDNIVLPGGKVVTPGRYVDKVLGTDISIKEARLEFYRLKENQQLNSLKFSNREELWSFLGKRHEEKFKRLKRGM